MNKVNRAVIIVALLVIMVLCTITLLFPVRVLNAAARQLRGVADYVASLGRPFRDFGWFVRVAVSILFLLTLNIIGILLVIAEVRWPAPRFIRAEKTTGGEVRVSVSSIAERLKYEIDQIAGVLRCKPKVSAKRGGVVVELDVETAVGIDVPTNAEQIAEATRLVVEEKMGLKLARPPAINLRTVPYPRAPLTPPASGAPLPQETVPGGES